MILMTFGIKENTIILTHINVLLAFATNITGIIKTDSVLINPGSRIVFILNLGRWSIKGGSY